jgi:hypothetical protein
MFALLSFLLIAGFIALPCSAAICLLMLCHALAKEQLEEAGRLCGQAIRGSLLACGLLASRPGCC